MFRAKTVKRSASKKNTNNGPITPSGIHTIIDLSGAHHVELQARNSNLVSTESMLSALLDAESKTAVLKPWLRLERGLRMRLLRSYVEKYQELTPSERTDLLNSLVEALDKKLLNSKSQITYNTDTGEIVEINALKIIQGTGGKKIFRIEPPHRSTKKARRPTGSSDSE
jgi:hypothetical protein